MLYAFVCYFVHLRILSVPSLHLQTQAEDILLENSGEYISCLVTKKLDRPRKQRHVRDAPCLCQYVEQRVYKMIV